MGKHKEANHEKLEVVRSADRNSPVSCPSRSRIWVPPRTAL